MAKKSDKPLVASSCATGDYFCEAAYEIGELPETDSDLARDLWGALKESAQTDVEESSPLNIFTPSTIATNIEHTIEALRKKKVLLTIEQSYTFLGTISHLIGDFLPPSLGAFKRTFKKRFVDAIGRPPHNHGSEKRPRYAVTYAELLHMHKLPSLQLVQKLNKKLRDRLEEL